MAAQLGDNISSHKNIQVLSASTAVELSKILGSIQLPISIVSIYAQGSRHYAWIVPSRPVKVVRKKKTKKKTMGNTTSETQEV